MNNIDNEQLERYSRQIIINKLGIKGQKKIFNANIGVVLSAGAINSPTILQRSGIGDANDLNNLDNTHTHTHTHT